MVKKHRDNVEIYKKIVFDKVDSSFPLKLKVDYIIVET